ncbi:hypothetical protein KEM48_006441 [Puccinia striiformis f. sp. tritici PST-130]|nr:hypothetical protein KEM48_006441 [Puccinia striiformis f. sp. tritici PST-130]
MPKTDPHQVSINTSQVPITMSQITELPIGTPQAPINPSLGSTPFGKITIEAGNKTTKTTKTPAKSRARKTGESADTQGRG